MNFQFKRLVDAIVRADTKTTIVQVIHPQVCECEMDFLAVHAEKILRAAVHSSFRPAGQYFAAIVRSRCLKLR